MLLVEEVCNGIVARSVIIQIINVVLVFSSKVVHLIVAEFEREEFLCLGLLSFVRELVVVCYTIVGIHDINVDVVVLDVVHVCVVVVVVLLVSVVVAGDVVFGDFADVLFEVRSDKVAADFFQHDLVH